MPSILHIIQTLSGGGAAREMLNISRYSTGSSEYSHQISTLMQSSEHGLALAADAGVSVLDAPAPEQLREAIGDADIVQLEWWNCPELTAFLTSRIPASRFVIRYHVAGHRAPQNIIPEYLRLADFNIIAFDGAPALQSCDKSDRRLRKILHGADFARIPQRPRKGHDTFNVGYIGTVSFVKMHPDFVRLSAGINVPNLKVVVCGGVEEKILPAQVNALGANDKFDFRGYVENLSDVIAEMDVFGYPLCPDTYASTDLVLQEVMYAGVPAVVFPHGGLLQTVKDGYNGMVVTTEEEYRRAIEYLYQNKAERDRLGENAKEFVTQYLGVQNTVRDYH